MSTQTLLIAHRDKAATKQLERAVKAQSVKGVNRLLRRERIQLQLDGKLFNGHCTKFLNGQPFFELWKQD